MDEEDGRNGLYMPKFELPYKENAIVYLEEKSLKYNGKKITELKGAGVDNYSTNLEAYREKSLLYR